MQNLLKQRRLQVTALMLLCLLAAGGLSKPGRTVLAKIFSAEKSEKPTTAEPKPTRDIAEEARVRHGWKAELASSVSRGQITYYTPEGKIKDQARIIVYRKYPDQFRVEVEGAGKTETFGLDRYQVWKGGAARINSRVERDILSWLRIGPEALFLARSKGAGYREIGTRVEESRPATPGQAVAKTDTAVEYVQVEVNEEAISTGRDTQTNKRKIYYYIDKQSLLVSAARWLEPDDPQRSGDPTAPRMDVRIDFANWLDVDGVMWPTEITHRFGGKVDYRIVFEEVKLNDSVQDALFQKPAR